MHKERKGYEQICKACLRRITNTTTWIDIITHPCIIFILGYIIGLAMGVSR